jgi:vancomycin resistance protein YoaR
MQTTLHPSSGAPSGARPPLRRTALDLAAIWLLLAGLLAITLPVAWQFWHTNRIYTGVSVGGVPVGGLTRAAAIQRLQSDLYAYPLPPVVVDYQGKQWPLQTGQARAEADMMAAVNQAYLVGRQSSLLGDTTTQLQAALFGKSVTPPLEIAPEPLRAAIQSIAATVDKAPAAARAIGSVAVPAEEGTQVNVEDTLRDVMAALQRTDLHATAVVPLTVATLAPPAAAAAENVLPQVAAVQQPLLLRAEPAGLEIALDPAKLSQLVVATNPLQLDASGLRAYLESFAGQVDVPPRDARLDFDPTTGAVTVIQTSQPGRKLDVEATVEGVQSALTAGSMQAPLALVDVAPAVDSNRVAEMGIRELVASSSTYFAGSSASRVRNIEVAADKFEGVVVPPDGIFSFNEIVRDVSSANGFEDGLVIWGDRTAVGVGGGVCQVSTTVFRSAYEGGFPIVARTNHGYVVDWYGEPGMDATIFTPYVDFQFRNDTGAYLLLDPVVDSANGVMTFNFYGTAPNRTVTVSKPEIKDVKAPKPPQYVVDESLAAGAKKQVDWEKEGMTVTVTRTIVEDGTTRTDTLASSYEPWQAVYLVGPGTEIPATPTPTVDATTTPEAAAP